MRNIKLDIKNNINLILSIRNNLFFIFGKFFLLFICFNSTILSCDKAKLLINVSINLEIKVEYAIWGI